MEQKIAQILKEGTRDNGVTDVKVERELWFFDEECIRATLTGPELYYSATFFIEDLPVETIANSLLCGFWHAIEEDPEYYSQKHDLKELLSSGELTDRISLRPADVTINRRFLDYSVWSDVGNDIALVPCLHGHLNEGLLPITPDMLPDGMSCDELTTMLLKESEKKSTTLLMPYDPYMDEQTDVDPEKSVLGRIIGSEDRAEAYFLTCDGVETRTLCLFYANMLERIHDALGDNYYVIAADEDGFVILPAWSSVKLADEAELRWTMGCFGILWGRFFTDRSFWYEDHKLHENLMICPYKTDKEHAVDRIRDKVSIEVLPEGAFGDVDCYSVPSGYTGLSGLELYLILDIATEAFPDLALLLTWDKIDVYGLDPDELFNMGVMNLIDRIDIEKVSFIRFPNAADGSPVYNFRFNSAVSDASLLIPYITLCMKDTFRDCIGNDSFYVMYISPSTVLVSPGTKKDMQKVMKTLEPLLEPITMQFFNLTGVPPVFYFEHGVLKGKCEKAGRLVSEEPPKRESFDFCV